MLAWSCKFNFLMLKTIFYLLCLFRKYWFYHLHIKELSLHHWAISSMYFSHSIKDWIHGKKGKLIPQVFAHMGLEGLVFNSIKQNSKHANTEQPRNVTRILKQFVLVLLPYLEWIWNPVLALMLLLTQWHPRP